MKPLNPLVVPLLAAGLYAQLAAPPDRANVSVRTPPDATQNQRARPQATPAAVPVSSFQQVGRTTGWASTGKALIGTEDAGQHWTDITPPDPHYNRLDESARLVDVSFLNPKTGWVLICYGPTQQADWAFDVASTRDGGKTWVTSAVTASDLATDRLAGGGHISFSDALHGWANLDLQSSSAFNLAVLLATKDGGQTWTYVPGDPSLEGPVVRASNGDGWILHNGGEDLEVSRDRGRSFRQLKLSSPPNLAIPADASRTLYGLPAFSDGLRGTEPVLFTTREGSKSELVLFLTEDGGKTWSPNRRVTGLGPTSLNTVQNTSFVDHTWLVPVGAADGIPTVLSIEAGSAAPSPAGTSAVVFASSFITRLEGWVSSKAGLFATSDGGRTWRNISPTFTSRAGE